MSPMTLLERVSDRVPVRGGDGRSGARLETGLLDGVLRVWVKTAPADGSDAVSVLTGEGGREMRLWQAGVFERLPDVFGSALVGCEEIDGSMISVTRDLGPAMLGWDRTLSQQEVRRVFRSVSALHRRFLDDPPPGLLSAPVRTSLFAPTRWSGLPALHDELASAVTRGHALLCELLEPSLAAAVEAHLDDSRALAAALGRGGLTLLHGDLWPVNLALEEHRVVALDWELATAGPPLLDLLSFCAAAMSHVALDRDGLLAEAAAALRWCTDRPTLALGAFWVVLEAGWNKALDAVDHPDHGVRARQRADLDFWVARAREAMDAGTIPTPERV